MVSTVRALLSDTAGRLRGHDVVLASAGSTLYGALAVVPSLLVAIAVARPILGERAVRAYGARLADALPSAMNAGGAVRTVLDAGLALSPLGVVFAVVMGSAYGEGLSRAFTRLAPARMREAKPPSWWLRAATLPLLGLAPLMLSGLLLATPSLTSLQDRHGPLGAAVAVYLSLTLVWVLTWLPLAWTFHVVGPGSAPAGLSWRAAGIGAVVSGAFVSGFLHGFLVFLAVPVDLGRPFGGLLGVGVASAVLLWLWVLHAVVLVGYAFAWAVDARLDAGTT